MPVTQYSTTGGGGGSGGVSSYEQDLSVDPTFDFTVNHSLGTEAVVVNLFNPSGVKSDAQVTVTDSNNVDVSFNPLTPSGTYKIVVQG